VKRIVATLLLPACLGHAAPSFESRVQKGVERGVAFLLEEFDEKEGWGPALGTGTYGNQGRAYPYAGGPTAVICYALLKADLPRDHKVLKRAMSFLRVKHRKPGVTYEMAVVLLAVAEYAGAKECPDYREPGRREQRTLHRFRKPKDHPFRTMYWTWMVDLAKKLIAFQARNGGWRYYPDDFHSGGSADTSSTQFALLALSTASRCGVAVPREVFAKAHAYLLEAQRDKGPLVPRAVHVPGGPENAVDEARPFPYIAGSDVRPYRRPSGGMTAAGVASLLLLREELGKTPESEKAIRDGFAWLGRYFTVRVNPGYAPFLDGSYHFVWLYALERCGDLANRELIGGRSWFPEGARYLLSIQRDDGAFPDPTCMNPKDRLGTAFALLFLTRAHQPVSGGR